MTKCVKKIAAIFLALILMGSFAFAVEVEIQGEGRALIGADIQSVQAKAKKEALRNAIKIAVNRVLGSDAMNNPKVNQKFEDIVGQINTYKVKISEAPSKEGNDYIINATILIDETKFRQLISDMGIAINTSTARSSAILTVMDEFYTTPTDLQSTAPLKEVTVYTRDKDSSYKEGESLKARNKEASSSSKRSDEASSLDARGQTSASYSAKNKESGSLSAQQKDSASYAGKGSASSNQSVDAKYAQKGSVDANYNDKSSVDARSNKKTSADSASMKKSSLDYGSFVDASDSDHTFYSNVKEYQPKNAGPDKQNYTIKSLQSSFQTYDLRILDNDIFRSKYFKDNAITIEKLENSEELSKYVKYARDEAKADFFSIGSAVIIDRGRNENTGMAACDGIVAIKVYSTLDAEAIASGAITESATGNSPDACRANVAKKAGTDLGNVISNKVQEYWKKRQMYGREYVVVLTGFFNPMGRKAFMSAVQKVQGVSNVQKRTEEEGKYEFVVTYAGSDALPDSIFTQVVESASPIAATFNNYDYTVNGNQIKFYAVGSKK